MKFDRDALVQAFFEDAAENLASMEQSLATLAERPGDGEAARTVFRGAHTIKGNAATLEFGELVQLARLTQEVADRVREKLMPATPELLSLLRRSVDVMREMVPAAAAKERTVKLPEDLMRQLASCGARAAHHLPGEGK